MAADEMVVGQLIILSPSAICSEHTNGLSLVPELVIIGKPICLQNREKIVSSSQPAQIMETDSVLEQSLSV